LVFSINYGEFEPVCVQKRDVPLKIFLIHVATVELIDIDAGGDLGPAVSEKIHTFYCYLHFLGFELAAE